MDLEDYRRRLLAEEQRLSDRIERARADVREPGDGVAHDTADDSSIDELKEEELAESDADRTILGQVRDALKRIADGTFGTCVVDGRPIEPKRLEAMPWTPYCLEHQQARERAESLRRPTL